MSFLTKWGMTFFVCNLIEIPCGQQFQHVYICLRCRETADNREEHYKHHKHRHRINYQQFFAAAAFFKHRPQCIAYGQHAEYCGREVMIHKCQACNHNPRQKGRKITQQNKYAAAVLSGHCFYQHIYQRRYHGQPYSRVAKGGNAADHIAKTCHRIPYRLYNHRPCVPHG